MKPLDKKFALKVGNRIQGIRCDAGYTQMGLCEKLGVSYTLVNQWEHGRHLPRTQNLRDFCLLFDVSADYLFGFTEFPS